MNFKTPLEQKPSFLYRFNPTLKIICMIILLVLVFLPVPVIFQASMLILVIGLWISAKLPAKKLKPIFITLGVIFIFVFLINWLASKDPGLKVGLENIYQLWGSSWTELADKGYVNEYLGQHWTHGQIWGGWVDNVLTDIKPVGSYISYSIDGKLVYLAYSSPWYGLSSQVVITTLSTCVKLFNMLAIFSLLVNTTSTLQLTYGFEHVLWPLKWIKVPVTEISYIIANAIGFVPNLFKEAKKIINAQAIRGVDFRNGHLITKIRAVTASVVPVFGASFNHADKLSDAMEARNFVPRAKRTKYRLYHCSVGCWVSFAILICLLALFIYLCACKVIIYPCMAIDCFNI